MACTSECITENSCSSPVEHIEGAVLTPFVQLNIQGGSIIYTVGNKPNPQDKNRTSIKSFQYGFSIANGAGVKFELISEGGLAYLNLVENLNKTVTHANEDTAKTWFTFGWLRKDCQNNMLQPKMSDPVYLMGKNVQTVYENGVMKITYECLDIGSRIFERTLEFNSGASGELMPLKQAIIDILEKNDPKVKVEFKRKDGTEWYFKNGMINGPDKGKKYNGPMGIWRASQQNALSAIRKWLAGQRTNDDKGIIFQFDPKSPQSKIILLEDTQPGKDEKINCCKNNEGTYVVNGGNCTDVISFSPTIDWILTGPGKGGGGTGPFSANFKKAQELDKLLEEKEDSGTKEGTNPSPDSTNYDSPKNVNENSIKSSIAQTKANAHFEATPGIQGELKIIGDPKFWWPVKYVGSTLAIIVIEPYHLQGCQWISNPQCNIVLSNKNWLITGIDHQITEGSFETTIKVMLSAPNSDINQDSYLGGNNCGKYQPKNTKGKPLETPSRP